MAENQSGEQSLPGLIDTIGYAFALLNRRPYLIWVPVLVDALVWTGFRLQLVNTPETEPSPENSLSSMLIERLGEIEFVTVTTWPIPNLLGQAQFSESPSPFNLPTLDLTHLPGGLLVALGFAISVILLSGWALMLARLVSDAPATDLSWLTDSPGTALRGALAALLGVGIVALLAVPMLFVAGGLHLMSVNPIVLLTLSIFLLSSWLGLFFIFSLPALALGEQTATGALRSSYQLVMNHFLAVVGLLLIIVLIRAATPHALSVFAESQWSVPFAIIVNAYIVTGLFAAVLLFYQNRSSHAQPSPVASPVAARGR